MIQVFPTTPDSPPVVPAGVDWQQKRKTAVSRLIRLRLDQASIRPVFIPRGYTVTIEGEHLYQAISPPRVTVGDIVLEGLRFSTDGRVLKGRLSAHPTSRRVIVDYHFDRAEIDLSNEVRWWHWIRPALLELWQLIDRGVRWLIARLP